MLNKQPIEKRAHLKDGTLDIHSIFNTIQGEGPFCGTPCVFVRLAGCNLQCPACDTDYTSFRSQLSVATIAAEVIKTDQRPWHKNEPHLVVITGGEPWRQNIVPLMQHLLAAGYYIQIETNGTLHFDDLDELESGNYFEQKRGVYVVCSPKTGKIHANNWRYISALKYVVRDGDIDLADGLPNHALDHTGRPVRPPQHWDRPIYIQPLDSKSIADNHRHTAAAVKSSLEHGYTLQLQVHKYIGVE